jgi:YggT family protein
MFSDAAQFLLRTLFDLAACAFFLRFWMQWARVPFHNSFAQFVVRVTDFAVKPLRRLLPGLFGLDWASLLPFSSPSC